MEPWNGEFSAFKKRENAQIKGEGFSRNDRAVFTPVGGGAGYRQGPALVLTCAHLI